MTCSPTTARTAWSQRADVTGLAHERISRVSQKPSHRTGNRIVIRRGTEDGLDPTCWTSAINDGPVAQVSMIGAAGTPKVIRSPLATNRSRNGAGGSEPVSCSPSLLS